MRDLAVAVAAACSVGFAAYLWSVRRRRGCHASHLGLRADGVIFTGTGCSSGLPLVQCTLSVPHSSCTACRPALQGGPANKNWRGNVGALIRFTDPGGVVRHIQIDCGKTFRDTVMLRVYREHGIQFIDALLLTHDHADAVGGIDEVRALQKFDPVTFEIDTPIRVLCDRRTLTRLRHMYPYLHPKRPGALAFAQSALVCKACELDWEPPPGAAAPSASPAPSRTTPPTAAAPSADGGGVKRFVAKIDWEAFGGGALEQVSAVDIHGLEITCLPVWHGEDYISFGFGWGPEHARVVYLSDYTALCPSTEALLTSWASQGSIALLVLDALRMSGAHPVHATGDESIELARRLRPTQALLVGMGHSMEHEATNQQLHRLKQEGLDIQLAFDGQFVPLELSASARASCEG